MKNTLHIYINNNNNVTFSHENKMFKFDNLNNMYAFLQHMYVTNIIVHHDYDDDDE